LDEIDAAMITCESFKPRLRLALVLEVYGNQQAQATDKSRILMPVHLPSLRQAM
jgi:hypothetical protein